MNPLHGPEYLPNLMLLQGELPSDREPDLRVSGESHKSKPDICRSGLVFPKTRFSEFMGRGRRDARIGSITETFAHITPSDGQGGNIDSPLRLALARRSVKNQIFACMDKGDKKAEIESTTGLSHGCIKWHRRLWRNEGSHPRPRSKKLSKRSARGPRSPGMRSQRPLIKRPACKEKGDSAVASESISEKRRRKHRAMKQSKGRSVRTELKMAGSGGGECAERKTRGSSCFVGKENVLERDEAMAMSGELKTLPIRDLGS